MSNKAFQDALLAAQDKQINRLESTLSETFRRVQLILPQLYLHAIPMPRNMQATYGRDPNMTAMFRELVEKQNAMLPPGAARRFLNFSSNLSNEEINEDAKRTLNALKTRNLKDGWKSKTWADVCETDGAGAEAVMDEAASRPELIVFAQGGGYWAMRILADQTQKSVSVL